MKSLREELEGKEKEKEDVLRKAQVKINKLKAKLERKEQESGALAQSLADIFGDLGAIYERLKQKEFNFKEASAKEQRAAMESIMADLE